MKKNIKEQLESYEEIVQIKPIPIPESMQKLVDEEVKSFIKDSGVSEELLGKSDVYDDIGRDTFEKIAREEYLTCEIAAVITYDDLSKEPAPDFKLPERTDQALECLD